MENETVLLLKECRSGCKMAVDSIEQVREFVEDKELGHILNKYRSAHEDMEEQIREQLDREEGDDKEPPAMASAMACLGTEFKMLTKGSTRQAAKIMMDGCNMGVQSMCEYMHKYEHASEASRKLAEAIADTEEQFREELKAFL